MASRTSRKRIKNPDFKAISDKIKSASKLEIATVVASAAGAAALLYLIFKKKEPAHVSEVPIVLVEQPNNLQVFSPSQALAPEPSADEDRMTKRKNFELIMRSSTFGFDEGTIATALKAFDRSKTPTFGDMDELKLAVRKANQTEFKALIERIFPGCGIISNGGLMIRMSGVPTIAPKNMGSTPAIAPKNMSGMIDSSYVVPGVAMRGVSNNEDKKAKRAHLAQTCANAGIDAFKVCTVADSKNLDWAFLRRFRDAVDSKNFNLAREMLASRGLPLLL